MDHGLELILPILEILEIEVSNILYNPGNIGNGIPNLKMFQSTGGSHKTSRSQQRPQKKHRRLSLYCFCDLIIYNPWIRSEFAVPAIAQFSSMSISRPAHLPCKLLIDPGNIWKLIIKIF